MENMQVAEKKTLKKIKRICYQTNNIGVSLFQSTITRASLLQSAIPTKMNHVSFISHLCVGAGEMLCGKKKSTNIRVILTAKGVVCGSIRFQTWQSAVTYLYLGTKKKLESFRRYDNSFSSLSVSACESCPLRRRASSGSSGCRGISAGPPAAACGPSSPCRARPRPSSRPAPSPAAPR